MKLPLMINVQQLKQQLQAGNDLVLLDVRTAAEFESIHIEGSLNVGLDQIEHQRQQLSESLKHPIVLVCRSDNRARQAAALLDHVDLPNLHILEGGIQAWQAANEPVKQGRQRWALDRQVRGLAGSIVLLSMLASLFWPPLRWIAAFMGAGLTYSALTDSCAMGMLLSKLPYNRQPTNQPSFTPTQKEAVNG